VQACALYWMTRCLEFRQTGRPGLRRRIRRLAGSAWYLARWRVDLIDKTTMQQQHECKKEKQLKINEEFTHQIWRRVVRRYHRVLILQGT
jgi:hypothetical protein